MAERHPIERKLNQATITYFRALYDYVVNRNDVNDAGASLAAVVLALPEEIRDAYEAAIVRLTPPSEGL